MLDVNNPPGGPTLIRTAKSARPAPWRTPAISTCRLQRTKWFARLTIVVIDLASRTLERLIDIGAPVTRIR
jgi:hypothetical protein